MLRRIPGEIARIEMKTDSSSIILTTGNNISVDSHGPSVSDIISNWPGNVPFRAQQILEDHPEFRRHKSIMLDLAYEEYCQRITSKEVISEKTFVEGFDEIKKSLACLIDVHKFLNADPELLGVDASLWNEQQDLLSTREGLHSTHSKQPSVRTPKDVWPKQGDSFSGMTLIKKFGEGSFARVFLASEADTNRMVVLKICSSYNHELDVVRSLDHPNIVRFLSVRSDSNLGLSAICMPYVSNTTVKDVIDIVDEMAEIPLKAEFLINMINEEAVPNSISPNDSSRGMPYVDIVVGVGAKLVEVLTYLQGRNVCHGDIKPDNILIGQELNPILVDFNLATQSGDGTQIRGGTIAYMAPELLEQIASPDSGERRGINIQTDLFSLGVTLYEMLTGSLPFQVSNKYHTKDEAAREMLEQQAKPITPIRKHNRLVDPGLAYSIEKCLQYNASQRWGSLDEFNASLTHSLTVSNRLRRWIIGRSNFLVASSIACAFFIIFSIPWHSSAFSLLGGLAVSLRAPAGILVVCILLSCTFAVNRKRLMVHVLVQPHCSIAPSVMFLSVFLGMIISQSQNLSVWSGIFIGWIVSASLSACALSLINRKMT